MSSAGGRRRVSSSRKRRARLHAADVGRSTAAVGGRPRRDGDAAGAATTAGAGPAAVRPAGHRRATEGRAGRGGRGGDGARGGGDGRSGDGGRRRRAGRRRPARAPVAGVVGALTVSVVLVAAGSSATVSVATACSDAWSAAGAIAPAPARSRPGCVRSRIVTPARLFVPNLRTARAPPERPVDHQSSSLGRGPILHDQSWEGVFICPPLGRESSTRAWWLQSAAMPELPDLTIVAEAFHTALVGGTITRAEAPAPLAVRARRPSSRRSSGSASSAWPGGPSSSSSTSSATRSSSTRCSPGASSWRRRA